MNRDVIITCAVTGAGDTTGKSDKVPVTPEEVAAAAIEAAQAGAAVAHIHVRDPQTGKGSRDVELFREAVRLVRESNTDVIINLTAGMGGDWVPSEEDPSVGGPGTDMIGPEERLAHVIALKPEICSLDCGTMNFGGDHVVEINIPSHVRTAAELIRDCGVKAELEVFDLGQLMLANELVSEGLVLGTPLYQFCLGIPGGAPATPVSLQSFVSHLPQIAHWTAFGISRMQMPMVAQSILSGGHCRVGLEDNLYLSRGRFASNAELVEKAIVIIENMGATVLSPAKTRSLLGISG